MSPAGAVRRIALPAAARRLATLARVDYADAFLVETGPAQDRTAEGWARAVLEGAPGLVRAALPWGWRVLGLERGRDGSGDLVLGWRVLSASPDVVLLGAGSHVGMPAELLFQRRRRALLFATFVQHDNPVVRAMWAGVAPFHRQVVRQVLGPAASSR